MTKNLYDICLHPIHKDMPAALFYDGVKVADFDVIGLIQRFGHKDASRYLYERIEELNPNRAAHGRLGIMETIGR